jgi:HNH endonuclease
MMRFEYPTGPHMRRHGPAGYQDYGSYRDWLRDEFMFRCVYCLQRERWYGRSVSFHIDHYSPVAVDPIGQCEYTNLLYACAACNEAKKNILGVPNPCETTFRDCLRMLPDGHVQALNDDGERLKRILGLDSDKNVGYRRRWMRNLDVLRTLDIGLYQEFMGFPDDLPDLRKKRVPNNTKPEGAADCYFALRERGVLPAMY